MAGFSIVLLMLFFVIPLLVILLALAIAAVLVGSGATALAAGGLAGASFIEDVQVRKLAVMASLAVLALGLCCFSLVGVFFWPGLRLLLMIAAFALAIACMVVGIIGITRSARLMKKSVKVLFIILFSLTIGLGLFFLFTDIIVLTLGLLFLM